MKIKKTIYEPIFSKKETSFCDLDFPRKQECAARVREQINTAGPERVSSLIPK